MSDDFDGRVLNPEGIEIDLPYWAFKRLKRLRLLDRDSATGMRRIQRRIFGLMDLWEGPDFNPDHSSRAVDPNYQQACSKDSGYASSFLKAIGRDCSGLVNPASDIIRDLESNLAHSRLSEESRRVAVEEVLRTVRAKRKKGKRA